MINHNTKKILFAIDTGIIGNIDAFINIMNMTEYDFTICAERFVLNVMRDDQKVAGWKLMPYDDIYGSFDKDEAKKLSSEKPFHDGVKGTARGCRNNKDDYSKDLFTTASLYLKLRSGLDKIIEQYDAVIIPDEFCWNAVAVRDSAQAHGVPTILNQCGPMHKEGFEFFPAKVDHICAWGKVYYDRFKNDGRKNVYMTGSPRLDRYYNNTFNKDYPVAYFPTRNPGQFPDYIYDYVDLEVMKFGHIIVQPHPHQWGLSRHKSTEEVICGCDVAISIFSTTLFEAMLVGKPAIQILPKGVESPIDYPNRFDTAEEAKSFLKKNDLSKQNEWIKERYVCDGDSTIRFMEVIRSVVNG